MVDDMSVFSERLIALMKQNGINQKELAQKAGVTESAMSYYVKGDRTPRSDVLTSESFRNHYRLSAWLICFAFRSAKRRTAIFTT